MLINEMGDVVHQGGAFVEDGFIVDLDNLPRSTKQHHMTDVEEAYEALVLGVRDYIHKCGFQKVVIGLSGGIDSALVAALAVDAIGAQNVMGISMPTRFSSKESVSLSRELSKRLGTVFEVINIDETFENYLNLLEPHFAGTESGVTEENLQARIRGNILMAFSNKFGAMVLSTGNKSEIAVGYCTLYGDLAGGLAVISDIPKSLVYKLSEYINRDGEVIPVGIIRRPPSAELRPDQTDQDSLPPYDILDPILKAYVEDHLSIDAIVDLGFDRKVVKQITFLVRRSEYKRRQAPPGLKVTSKAFGWGRRFPIACK
jgi:NAD+ synthase (glutamine-hydrolysing)